jgi:hypothetical protein
VYCIKSHGGIRDFGRVLIPSHIFPIFPYRTLPTYPILGRGWRVEKTKSSKYEKTKPYFFPGKFRLGAFWFHSFQGFQMTDSFTPENPLHVMPFIYKRGHLHPDEMGYQTPPHRAPENPKFAENVSKPDGGNRPATNHSDPQSTT